MEEIENTEAQAIEALLKLAFAAWCLADDSEDLGDGYHKVDHDNFEALCDGLNALDELPQDQPGYIMAPAAKARWSLRNILSSPSRDRVEVAESVEAELAKMLAATTPGPWVISRPEQKGEDWPNGIIVAATARGMGIFASGDTGTFPSADRQLIAAMRNHLPGILAALAAQRERVEVLEEALRRMLTVFDTPSGFGAPGAEQETCAVARAALGEKADE